METEDNYIAKGKEIGLTGEALLKYVNERLERDERQRERDLEREEREKRVEREEKELNRQHQLQMEKIELEKLQVQAEMKKTESEERHRASPLNSSMTSTESTTATGKVPKLPAFKEGQDELDSYLRRFERFAKSNKWEETTWATYLSPLLIGAALDVYSRMAVDAAKDYTQMKEALLNRYNLTEEGYRMKFRTAKP